MMKSTLHNTGGLESQGDTEMIVIDQWVETVECWAGPGVHLEVDQGIVKEVAHPVQVMFHSLMKTIMSPMLLYK